MSAKRGLPQWFIQQVAENDSTYTTNARLLFQTAKRGGVNPVQLNNGLRWLQMAAVRRYEASVKVVAERRQAA